MSSGTPESLNKWKKFLNRYLSQKFFFFFFFFLSQKLQRQRKHRHSANNRVKTQDIRKMYRERTFSAEQNLSFRRSLLLAALAGHEFGFCGVERQNIS